MLNLIGASGYLLSDLPIIGPVLRFIEDLIPIGSAIDRAYDFATDLSFGEQLAFSILLALIVILGVVSLVRKMLKLLIVIAILFGLWLLYNQGIIG